MSYVRTSIDLHGFCMQLRVLNRDGSFWLVVTGLGGELLNVLNFRVMCFCEIFQLGAVAGKDNVESFCQLLSLCMVGNLAKGTRGFLTLRESVLGKNSSFLLRFGWVATCVS